MDTEDESTAYLKYLNDPTTPNNYLLSNGVELTDSFPFAEIEATDWPSEGFPVLLSSPLTTEEYNNGTTATEDIKLFNGQATVIQTNGIKEGIGALSQDKDISGNTLPYLSTETNVTKNNNTNKQTYLNYTTVVRESIGGNKEIYLTQYLNNATVIQTDNLKENIEVVQTVDTDELSSENSFSYLPVNEKTNVTKNGNATKKTYINYAPIVKENPDGNKEIYLTEKDINNDASIIQLFNTDGSIITIDKSVLSSLNFPKRVSETEKVAEKKYEDYFSVVTVNKCKVCSFLCETEDGIKKHLNENHAKLFAQQSTSQPRPISILKSNVESNKDYTIFLCSICKLAYSEKEALREHMIQKHELIATSNELKLIEENGKEEKNPEEKKAMKNMSSFLIKQQAKARKKIKCSIKGCNLRFAREEYTQWHEQCHVGDNKKQFKCPQCEERFSIWRICSSHLWKSHKIDLGLLTCPMCNRFKSYSSISVMNHMAIHNEEKPFLCSDCGKGFKTMAQLKNHEVIHKKPEDLPNWSVMRQCHICERYFANSKCLKKHIQSVHENFKPFICNICGHKTARKAMLELHLRQHTGVKPHECPYCEYRTGDHNCLRKHIMRHIGAKKYLCPHCPYTSIQSASYKSHITHRHPGKSGAYSCSYCSYTCINLADYSAHLKRHEATLKENGNYFLASVALTENGKESNQQNEAITKQNEPDKQNDNQTQYRYIYMAEVEDNETQNCFLNNDQTVEETIDTGGITIPAGLEMQLVS